ncbi:MAG: hypothetical protein ABI113_11075 [Mucilaginibacter sp.]
MKLTAKQQRGAANQLAKHRAKRKAEMTEAEIQNFKRLQLKFQTEDIERAQIEVVNVGID